MNSSLSRSALLAGLALSTALSAHAVRPAPAAPPAEAAKPAEPPPPYVLKNKSTFSAVTDETRAPFWPIGWAKRKVSNIAAAEAPTAPQAPKITLDPAAYKLTSVLLGNPSFAIINGRTYSEGEFLRQPRTAAAAVAGAAQPRIRVYRISDGSVVLQYQEQLVTIGLQRPALAQRRGEEELLLEDRP